MELKGKNVVLSKNTVFDRCEELVKERHFGKNSKKMLKFKRKAVKCRL